VDINAAVATINNNEAVRFVEYWSCSTIGATNCRTQGDLARPLFANSTAAAQPWSRLLDKFDPPWAKQGLAHSFARKGVESTLWTRTSARWRLKCSTQC
jgi:hypothetical protein